MSDLPLLPDEKRVRIRFVPKGELITQPTADDTVGFVRRPAECDGVQVDHGDQCCFIPWSEIRGLRRRKRR